MDLFDQFDASDVRAIRARYTSDLVAQGQARATRRQTRYHMRRAKAEATVPSDLLDHA